MNCHSKTRRIALFAVILVFAASTLCAAAESITADAPKEFVLDAERLTYEDATGIASAEGNVRAKHLNMRMNAPYVQYDTRNEVIKAFSDSRNPVTMIVDDAKFTGQMAEFNTITREGVMVQPSGKIDALYVQGDSIRVMPYEEAVQKKVISGKGKAPAAGSDDMVALSENVQMTTCNFSHPHYHIVSEKMVVIPGIRTIVKAPKIYMGERYLFTYPFDYIIQGGKQNGVAPYFGYDSDLGFGVGIQDPVAWDSGQLNMNAIYWTDDEWEAKFSVSQAILPNLTLFAETNRLYNKDDKETLWRPMWGMSYSNAGWTATLLESERELIETEVRSGQDQRYNVWKKPEFKLVSPSYPFSFEGIKGGITLEAIYGRYQDNVGTVIPWTNRTALNLYSSGTFMKEAFESIRPFYYLYYRYYKYDDDADSTQKVFNMMLGFYWDIGSVNLATAYGKRWVDGESPLYWDREYDLEEIYQKISFTLPGGTNWEKWNFAVQARYDIDNSHLSEMAYKIAYVKHCLTFELVVLNKMPKYGDREWQFGLRFLINAYPQDEYRIGEPEIATPFGAW